MRRPLSAGHSLVELLVAMGLAALVGSIVLPAVLSMQNRSLAEVGRCNLQARAGRLLRFVEAELRGAAFLVGATPRRCGGEPPVVVQTSAGGNPAVTLDHALLIEDGGVDGNDALSVVRAESFFPPLLLAQSAAGGTTSLRLNRPPNQSPGSSRELRPVPDPIGHVVLANQRHCYPVGTAGQTVQLLDPLDAAAPAATELLGVRVYRFHCDAGGRLRRDDFTSNEILDDGVDGLQFEYLLASGQVVDRPPDPRAVRAVRLSLLVRDMLPDRAYRNTDRYRLGNRSYGPYHDAYRRTVVSAMVEVKNHALP
jgi:hypothetical protein